jgi:hypothetical protein
MTNSEVSRVRHRSFDGSRLHSVTPLTKSLSGPLKTRKMLLFSMVVVCRLSLEGCQFRRKWLSRARLSLKLMIARDTRVSFRCDSLAWSNGSNVLHQRLFWILSFSSDVATKPREIWCHLHRIFRPRNVREVEKIRPIAL